MRFSLILLEVSRSERALSKNSRILVHDQMVNVDNNSKLLPKQYSILLIIRCIYIFIS